MTEQRRPITNKALTNSLYVLLEAVERHHITLEGYAPQDLMRPVEQAIREAQRLVDIQIEKATLTEQEKLLSDINASILERKQKIAAMEESR
jgi:hypothetical protein